MTECNSTPASEAASLEELDSLVPRLLDVRDHLYDLHGAQTFVGEAVFELLVSDEAEPNTHGLAIVLRDLHSRGQSLLNEVDILLKRHVSLRGDRAKAPKMAPGPDLDGDMMDEE